MKYVTKQIEMLGKTKRTAEEIVLLIRCCPKGEKILGCIKEIGRIG